MGYSAYNHFIKDLTQISPVGAAFSEGDKVGFNGQLVVSDDINGNTFNSLYATLTYLGSEFGAKVSHISTDLLQHSIAPLKASILNITR